MPNEWISVKDKLPECFGRYLTCDEYGNIHIFFHHPSHHDMPFGITESDLRFYPPTHWMPLPEPPKEGADNG